MAPGGVEPPHTDSKFGPEPRQAETHRDDPVCRSGFCGIVAYLISAHLGGSGGPSVAPGAPNSRPKTLRLQPPSRYQARQRGESSSAHALDHLDELVHGISLPASELDQLPDPLHDGSALGRPGHRDPAPTSKFEQALVLKQPQRAQDGVGVDTEDSREVSSRRKSFTGLRLPVCDRTPYLGGDLEIEVGPVLLVHLDTNQCASNTSSLVNRWPA